MCLRDGPGLYQVLQVLIHENFGVVATYFTAAFSFAIENQLLLRCRIVRSA